MIFSQLLSVISDIILLTNNVSEQSKPILRNYPNCGELGDENNKECFWDCDWQPIPVQVLQNNGPFSITQFVKNTECLSDCTSIKECLSIYQPIYEELENSGETSEDVFYESVYYPTYVCLQEARQDSGRIVDATNALVFESCIVTFITSTRGYPCIDEFLISQTKGKKRAHKSEKDIKSLLQPSETRLSGYASGFMRKNLTATLHQYPWLCSLKLKGFYGTHRCGVTLLSAPPKPTILVSAAHCHYICKDDGGNIVQTCCCRNETEPSNCRQLSSYCGENPSLRLAEPKDLLIVCSEWDIGPISERLSQEDEVVLDVTGYLNHPNFNITIGPIGGNDIAVYFVNDTKLAKPGVLKRRKLYPACLPSILHKNQRGILAGWKDPEDLGEYYPENDPAFLNTVDSYRQEQLILRHLGMKNTTCKDPKWMNSNTFYPKGTICGSDPSMASCLDTGDSGSGLMMERFQGGYSWEGALSFYRGCDQNTQIDIGIAKFIGENPGVFTEGSCYLPWIAESYGLQLSPGLSTGCRQASGDIRDRNKKVCKAFNGDFCDFDTGVVFNNTLDGVMFGINVTGTPFDRCLFFGQGLTRIEMTYACLTSNYGLSICSNNCLGVEASDIVAGGTAIFFAATVSTLSTSVISAAAAAVLGIGGLGVAGMGAVAMMNCAGPLYCVASTGRCCLVVLNPATGIVCPDRC